MKHFRFAGIAAVLIGLATLTSCQSTATKSSAVTPEASSTQTKPENKDPVLYTAQDALNRMSGHALKWSTDAMPVHLRSEITSEANGQDGRATIWRGIFASPRRNTVKTFVCSGSRLPDAPPFGVSSAAAELPLTPKLSSLQFQPFLLKTNSDKAYEVAQEHGGSALVKKDPKQNVTYFVEFDPTVNAPLWFVVYGEDLKKNKGIGVINGLTGAFIRAHK